PFNEALFTSTSAVCVTGLVLHDTAAYWSSFSQAVILVMIQVGGMGVVTVAASFALISGRKISLMQRTTMQEAIAAPKTGGIVRLTGFIIKVTFIIELLGALIMMPVFCMDFGVKGIWMAVFHSISAFCNAGFDIMGTADAPFSSLTSYAAQPVINITIMLLVIVGGIGFLTWDDIRTNRLHLKQYRMQSKVILVTTAILLILPAAYFFFFEFSELPVNERILYSIFQAVTPRTAGFNTADLTAVTGAGQSIIIVLMLIGGSPGSTAGGMKTTTVAVLISNALAVFRRKEDSQFFGRRIDGKAVTTSATILIMYIILFFSGALIISITENLPMQTCLFETASAVGTVGLSLGITAELGILSQGILIILMFLGRVGGLTLIYAALSGVNKNLSKLPQERITVG
ncbi:MAG: TrkH family potassium uptake protein, partial [Eubacterium sp.]